jgi:hypothetical protein
MKKCLLSALFVVAACALHAEENKAATCSGPSCAPEAQANVKKEEAPATKTPDVDTTVNAENNAAEGNGAVEATEEDLEKDQEQDLKDQKAGK